MRIIKLTLKICNLILIVVLSAVLLFNIAGIVKQVISQKQIPLIFGIGNAIIVSGSMEPIIFPGDIVVIQRKNNYYVGDIVTFEANSSITHRIVAETVDGFITQGDANNARDPEIEKSMVIGKVVMIIPRAGKAILFLRSIPGLLLLSFGLIAVVAAPRLFRKTQ